jgi:putative heme-binding domain-containing protein
VVPSLGALACSLAVAFAQQPDRSDPATELASFKLPPGFAANLWASEKEGVIKPIQMRWDARGRLWVIQTVTYPQLKPGEVPNDKVLILEDTTGAGRADKVTVFADGLMIPTGLEIAPGVNGCYVGEGTKLWLLTDTDGDDKADKREVVLRGFGTGDNHQNINSFRWSPGGEIMFCQGLHAYARVETPHGIVALDEAGLWRYRPREQRLDAFYGGPNGPQNPWGWVFTRWGEPIVVAGNGHGIYAPAAELIRGWQKGRRENIWASHRGRKNSGAEIIESAHFPPEWQGAMLAGGYINNSVWTLKLEPDGAGFKITDHPTLPPLVQSGHGSFRPVEVKLGPDGAIYLCDWYNPIIGHYQASFRHPDRDKLHGRIWRVTHAGTPLLTLPPVLKERAPDLGAVCELLRSTDRFPREQAKLTLFGGDTAKVTKAVRTWYEQLDPNAPDIDAARMQALGAFEAHETVEVPLLDRVLAAKTPEARAYAAATLARWADRLPADYDPLQPLADLAHDADPRVRLAAIVAAGNIARAESMVVVLSAASQPRDPFIDTALSAATITLKPLWEPVLAKGAPAWKPAWRELVTTLDKPRPAPAPVTKVAQKVGTPIVAIYGRLRASPFEQSRIAAEVLTKGDAKRGAEIYRRPELACVSCHRIGEEGGQIGPALDSVGSAQPLEFLIGTVLEPQREIKEGFETLRVTTKDGKEHIGIIAAGTDAELTLRDPTGAERTVALADIGKREHIGSLMPAGLTDNLSPEDLRDLFAYLTQLGKPQ